MIAEGENLSTGSAEAPSLRVDFAGVFRDHLLVYGWVLGLFDDVLRAEIKYAELVFDLLSVAIPVPRPDVTQHFALQVAATNDNHGFCLMVALPDSDDRPSYLRLGVSLPTGQKIERAWPIGFGDLGTQVFLQKNQFIFNWLQTNLPAADAYRLRALTFPIGRTLPETTGLSARALRLACGVDECCLLQKRFLVIAGWVAAEDRGLLTAKVKLGTITLDFSADIIDFPYATGGSSMTGTARGNAVVKQGIAAVVVLPSPVLSSSEGVFEISAGFKEMRVRRDVVDSAKNSNLELAALFGRLDGDTAISLIERVEASLKVSSDPPTIEWLTAELGKAVSRLPTEMASEAPRALLHIDSVVAITDTGIFLKGWYFDADGDHEVAYHDGFTRLRIDDGWVRMPRLDVNSHLATLGLTASYHDQGFLCYVPLASRSVGFLSVTPSRGIVRRMRLNKSAFTASPLQTVCTLLTSFDSKHRALRALLDRHVGPAVRAVWDRRRKPVQMLMTHRFGPERSKSQVSVIVPLFGRYDLAEYQMALFADDGDFQQVELIYFVDDPAIYDEFKAQCRDLFELYQVPFTLAFSGLNLGFAGANNCAATLASGKHLLLLNSDVMPKRPGWLGDLVDLYGTLEKPGLLGVKLLYEDGSVQHAGITFQRYAGWDGMWINEHLQKGQSPLGLIGIQKKADAVTAACALIDATVYRELGGLSEDYIIGDFEDSDLCLRAEAAGRRNYVTLDVELYHLERQSQDRIGANHWRTNLTLYNCWLHDQRWATQIEKQKG